MKFKMNFAQSQVNNMDRFIATAKYFGFSVRVTGGNFLTHEFNGAVDDFAAINELSK